MEGAILPNVMKELNIASSKLRVVKVARKRNEDATSSSNAANQKKTPEKQKTPKKKKEAQAASRAPARDNFNGFIHHLFK
ncbi:hypothetical protein E2562_034123 [Oryza meyeriana var. granulata]|uniref:Uncharacterized protein n=1 Tax=Oryza meyeriana var. granulata TaxID=110450 RepID=A0A6G1E760_9ORYZ|nr:hypothetical protein E2562_034123 [Oryza meyeriana var. granulata]